jgi:hypothetical protein
MKLIFTIGVAIVVTLATLVVVYFVQGNRENILESYHKLIDLKEGGLAKAKHDIQKFEDIGSHSERNIMRTAWSLERIT